MNFSMNVFITTLYPLCTKPSAIIFSTFVFSQATSWMWSNLSGPDLHPGRIYWLAHLRKSDMINADWVLLS